MLHLYECVNNCFLSQLTHLTAVFIIFKNVCGSFDPLDKSQWVIRALNGGPLRNKLFCSDTNTHNTQVTENKKQSTKNKKVFPSKRHMLLP